MTSQRTTQGTLRRLGIGAMGLLILSGCVELDNGETITQEQINMTFEPAPQSVDVPVNTNVTIRTGITLNPEIVNADTILLEGPDGEKVAVDVGYSNNVIELIPRQPLQPKTTYRTTVTNSVTSADGLELDGSISASFTTQTLDVDAPVPKLAKWESQMLRFGKAVGDDLMQVSRDQARNPSGALLDKTYYDGQRVFLQIAEYVEAKGEDASAWYRYATRAEDIYIVGYVKRENHVVAPWFRFSHGAYMQWQRTNNEIVRPTIIGLRDRPPFSEATSNRTSWYQQRYSREIAYAIQSNVIAEKMGEERKTERMAVLTDMALGHIEQWTTGNFIDPDPNWRFVQSFMTGLTATALIELQEHTPDARIQPAIKAMADWLWEEMWVANVNGSGYGAFKYVNRSLSGVGGPSPAPDLNMLILPMYTWLYKETGDRVYRERADLIFAGGVELAFLGGGKQFNQSYRDTFQALEWREEGLSKWGN